jgi:hypothetical protein
MECSFYCIIEPGELEIQTLLLVCSLNRRLQGDYRIYVCMPGRNTADVKIRPETEELLRDLDVKWIFFDNPCLSDRNKTLPGDEFSNKYIPLPQIEGTGYTVFLDSDMILLRDLNPASFLQDADFFAKPVCYMNETRWDALYGLFGMEVPRHRIRSTVDMKEGPPYFNGGLFCVRSSMANELSDTWQRTFKRISESGIMEDNPVNREQAALAVSVMQMQMTYQPLTEQMNFPARSKQLDRDTYPYFLHYHDPRYIYKNPRALAEARKTLSEYPLLATLALKMENWKVLITPSLDPRYLKTRIGMKLKGRRQLRRLK